MSSQTKVLRRIGFDFTAASGTSAFLTAGLHSNDFVSAMSVFWVSTTAVTDFAVTDTIGVGMVVANDRVTEGGRYNAEVAAGHGIVGAGPTGNGEIPLPASLKTANLPIGLGIGPNLPFIGIRVFNNAAAVDIQGSVWLWVYSTPER